MLAGGKLLYTACMDTKKLDELLATDVMGWEYRDSGFYDIQKVFLRAIRLIS